MQRLAGDIRQCYSLYYFSSKSSSLLFFSKEQWRKPIRIDGVESRFGFEKHSICEQWALVRASEQKIPCRTINSEFCLFGFKCIRFLNVFQQARQNFPIFWTIILQLFLLFKSPYLELHRGNNSNCSRHRKLQLSTSENDREQKATFVRAHKTFLPSYQH